VAILSRYLLREILTYFTISLFAFTCVLLTLRMLRFTSLLVNKGVEFMDIAAIFVAIIPTFLEFALPMATILGVMMAIARLSGDSEIIVLRASGISIFQLLRPILIFAIFTASLNFYVANVLKPWGYVVLDQALFRIAQTKTTSGLEAGMFNKLGNLTLYSEKVDYSTGELFNVLVDDRRGNTESEEAEPTNVAEQVSAQRRIIFASTGLVRPDPEQKTIEFYLRDGSAHELQQDTYVLTRFLTQNISVASDEITTTEPQGKIAPPRQFESSALRDYLLASDYRGTSAKSHPKGLYKRYYGRYYTEWVKRFSLPFACIAMALIGLPLGLQNPRTQRTWGIGLSAILALAAFMIYFVFFSVGSTVSESGKINPWLGLWIPNLVVLLTALFLVYKVASEKWSTGIEPIENFFMRLKR